jgi:hypothetical protein
MAIIRGKRVQSVIHYIFPSEVCLIATSKIDVDNSEDSRQKQITSLNNPEFIYSYLVI